MKKIITIFLAILTLFVLIACDDSNNGNKVNLRDKYDNGIYYSLFVRSFADSDGDGIGDLNGVTENLDYLSELGITGIWLLPIFESPSYHGYDTTDYYKIQEEYGTMEDLENLIAEADKLEIDIILDLVINHTSDKHPWFIDANSSKDSEYQNYYVWNSENSAEQQFVGGMVDLNLSDESVKDEIFSIIDFYMEKGINGFRFDAVKHFFAGVNEIGNDTIFMLELHNHIKNNNPNAFTVGEVYVNDYYFVSNYYRSQASYFNFYVQSEISSKIGQGSNSRLLVSNLEKMYNQLRNIKNDFVDSPFIGNHDMDRVASTMGFVNNNARLKQAANILLTLPGTPFIYYGDEIGLKGSRYEGTEIAGKVVYDEYRRQPFLWGDDRTTTWLASDGSNENTNSLAKQKEDEDSLLNTYIKIINIRKNTPALMYGNEFYAYVNNNANLQGYLRVINDNNLQEAVLVLNNVGTTDITIDYNLKYIYGSNIIKPYEMSIIEIPFDRIEDFK